MRLVFRLVLLLGLVLSATALSPVALAEDASATRSGAATALAADEPAPFTTTITAHPARIDTTGRATFTYEANSPDASFQCRLTGPGRTSTAFGTCPSDAPSKQAGKSTGSFTPRSLLRPGHAPFTFVVRAYVSVPPVPPATTPTRRFASAATYSWHRFTLYSPGHYSPRTGASFNRPLVKSGRRTNLTRVISTINSMPGYREAYPGACPSDPALVPGSVRVSLYSMTDGAFARAMVAARRRCLNVQILMNDHLTRKTDPAWRLLENAFGTSTARTSFAHRCHRGCRGGGVLHTKMYLFDSTTPVLSANRIRNTVLFGSSNMTSNAAKIQWNDLYGVRNDTSGLYKQFSRMFDLMKADNGYHRNPTLGPAGPFRATFWPAPAGSTDAYLTGLRSVSCTGVSGAGIGGRTVLYINMHAWFGTRGLALANQARRLYNRGCYVRVLYSFMSYGVYKKLHVGTGSRMSVRRTIFSHNGRTAYVYSHLKSIAISGNVAGNRSARVVWTGSNNFTNEGLNFDEVSVRIASASAYNSYARWFKYMSARKSSPVYANYSEPEGGGRAPKRTTAARAIASPSAPADAPTVVSPDVRVSDSGELSVPD